MLKQKLQHKLLQKLSPQQIQFIKLLQLNTTDFEQRVDEELIENPALEDGKEEEDLGADYGDKKDSAEEAPEEKNDLQDDLFDIGDYINNDDYDSGGFRLNEDNSDDDDKKPIPIAGGTTFQEVLLEQFRVLSQSEEELNLGRQLIGTIDEDGYLRRPLDAISNDLLFSRNIEASEEELEEVLQKIQTLDPPGIGARTLQECLLLQLQRKDQELEEIQLAIRLVQRHFDDFSKKHYEKLMRQMKIDDVELKEIISIITKLNPKPGESSSSEKAQYIIPDFILTNTDGKLEVALNSKNAPDLKISRSYMETLKGFDSNQKKADKQLKDTVQFIKQKLDSAKWFIDSIKQRQQTLLLTMRAIVKYQYDYFLDGDETRLRPMILKDIATEISMDVSTISRVANSKYVQTDFGIIPLKFFFSEGIQTEEGEEVSSREVKKILEDCIANEDKSKPLPDEKLMKILKEKGYNIARRTVAKYREQLNIPVARLRKEL